VVGCVCVLVWSCSGGSGSGLLAAESTSPAGSLVTLAVARAEPSIAPGGAGSEETAGDSAPDPGGSVRSGFARVTDAPSLDAVAGLNPTEWPWYAEGTEVPGDAVAGAGRLLSALNKTAVAGWRVLTAEEFVGVGDSCTDRRFEHVTLKDPVGGVLKAYAQPLCPGDSLGPEGGAYEYRELSDGGWAELDEGDNDSYVSLVRDGRMLVLWSIAVAAGWNPYFSAEQLLALADEVDGVLSG
jgi:hypothetical protein